MAHFTVQRNFLQVSLDQGQSAFTRRGGLIAMNDSIDMTSPVAGGIVHGLLRVFATGDTFFRQNFTASRGRGDLLLSPASAGDIKVVDIGERQYVLNAGVFLAAEGTVSLTPRLLGISKGFFGGGGFIVTETSGCGMLALNARGGIFEVEVKPGSDMLVDEAHLVAWEFGLKQSFKLGDKRQGHIAGKMFGSLVSGEGVLSLFSGQGRLVLSSLPKS